MFLLTKSTLFFLNHALDARTNKKFMLGGQIKTWKTGNISSESGQSALSTVSGTTAVTSISTNSHQSTSTLPDNNETLESFKNMVNEAEEHTHTVGSVKGEGKPVTRVSF